MKYLLSILLLVAGCITVVLSATFALVQYNADIGKQEIVTACQEHQHFDFGILKFECHQLWVME